MGDCVTLGEVVESESKLCEKAREENGKAYDSFESMLRSERLDGMPSTNAFLYAARKSHAGAYYQGEEESAMHHEHSVRVVNVRESGDTPLNGVPIRTNLPVDVVRQDDSRPEEGEAFYAIFEAGRAGQPYHIVHTKVEVTTS